MRANFLVSAAIVMLGVVLMTACDETKPKPPVPDGQPPKNGTAPSLGKPIGPKPFVYSKQQSLQLLGPEILSQHADQVRVFAGQFHQRAIEWKNDSHTNPCKIAIVDGPHPPEDDEIDFNVMQVDPSDGHNWPVFRAIVGPKGASTWTIENANKEDTRADIAEEEPILAMRKGYGVLGGRHPVVRGRRSRAGAPGTWIAIECSEEAGGKIDRYHLLNNKAGKTLNVYVEGVSKTTSVSAADTSYIMVGETGEAKIIKYNDATDDKEGHHAAFRVWARKVAECAGFEGGD